MKSSIYINLLLKTLLEYELNVNMICFHFIGFHSSVPNNAGIINPIFFMSIAGCV